EETLKKYSNQITLSWWSHDLCQEECSKKVDQKSPPNPIISGAPRGKIPQFENPELNDSLFSKHIQNQGFGNAQKESDGQVRRVDYFMKDSQRVYPSFPLALISQRLGKRPENLVSITQSPIDYLGPKGTIPRFSALELMQKANDRNLASEALDLEGKTVLIGLSAFGLVDEQVSPFDKALHGVEIQAFIADQILRRGFPREPMLLSWAVIFFFSFGLLLLTPILKTKKLIFLFISVLGAGYLIDFHMLFSQGVFCSTSLFYANVSLIAFSTLAGRFYEEYRQRHFLKEAFSKYLAPDVVKILLSKNEMLQLGGQKKEITTLFCDLRNFTQLSERLDPQNLTQILNETFTVLTAVIFKHQGTVDKYIGDALMAFFGAPLDQPDHAYRACLAAKEMVFEFQKKQKEFKERYGFELNLGIGINTGTASVGNMGSEQRFNYTALGDSVNIASRVESCTKEFGVSILTTQATLDSIQKIGLSLPLHHHIASTQLKGKSTPLDLFELVS
ncbi:MAG: adenylate/guanylate cyclase domain-containing protein, partial [Pseudomonadota bacterium]